MHITISLSRLILMLLVKLFALKKHQIHIRIFYVVFLFNSLMNPTVYDGFFQDKFIRRFIQNEVRDFMFYSVAACVFCLGV